MKQSILFFLLMMISLKTIAQKTRVSIASGASAYFGDIIDMPKINDFHPAVTVEGSVDISPILRLRLSASGMSISGDDKYSSLVSHKKRNLNFFSNIWDINLAVEYDLNDESEHLIIPYAFFGPGVFGFNPETKNPFTGNWVALQPLGTEGQGLLAFPERKSYSLTQMNIGFGGGIRMALNKAFQLSTEIFVRYTFTDYLDDISNRNYVDPIYFQNEGKLLSQKLSYRGDEYPINLSYEQKYLRRANDISFDLFYSAQIKLSYVVGNRFGNKNTTTKCLSNLW